MVFDEDTLVRALGDLPWKQRVAFAASCCQRLILNYEAFALMEGWGNPALLKQVMNNIWDWLAGAPFVEEHIYEVIQACEALHLILKSIQLVYGISA